MRWVTKKFYSQKSLRDAVLIYKYVIEIPLSCRFLCSEIVLKKIIDVFLL